jgi:hypothetical protein
MKKQLLTLALLSVGLSNAQVIWTEDFQTASPPLLPAGWLQNNVDGNTPSSTAVIAGFNFGTNAGVTRDVSAAFGYPSTFGISLITTSAYQPTGTSNDWIISPPILLPANAVLNWDSRSADQTVREAYEIRVSTTGTNVADFTANPILFATGSVGENYVAGTFTTRGVSLNSYAGQTIRLAVHDVSVNKWTAYYDNFEVSIPASDDGQVLSVNNLTRYMVGAGTQNISGTFRQMGYSPAVNAELNYNVNNGAATTQVITFGSPVQYFNQANFTFSTPANLPAGYNRVKIWVSEVNGNPETASATDTAYATVFVASVSKPRNALVEEWSSSTCAPCAALNVTFDPFLASLNPNTGSDMNVVKYQVYWPSPGNDPSYNPHGQARVLHYGINAAPSTYTNGRPSGTSATAINAAKNEPAYADITATLTAKKSSTLASAITTITAVANVTPYVTNAGNSPVRVFQVLTQKSYTYNSGTTSQKTYHHVMRKMQPNGWGAPVNLTDGTSFSVTMTHNPTFANVDPTPAQNSYNIWNIPAPEPITYEYVVFLQDTVSNHVLQSASWSATTTVPAAPINTVGLVEMSGIGSMDVYPSPANEYAIIGVDLVSSGKVSMQIADITGKSVFSKQSEELSAGRHEMPISTAELAPGTYIVSITAGEAVMRSKLVVTR